MRKILPFLFFALTGLLQAQIPSGYVQTTATLSPLAGGSFGAAWTNLSSSPQLGLLGCVSSFQTTVNGNFDAYGHFSVLLADTAQICPSPSTWTFTITYACPSGDPSTSFQVAVPVTGGGGTEDISTQISAAMPTNSCGGGSSGSPWPAAQFNALAFGAKGTGSADDTAGIQAAFTACYKNAAAGYGGVVLLPGGHTYVISSTINAYDSCQLQGTISGSGTGSTARTFGAGQPVPIVWNATASLPAATTFTSFTTALNSGNLKTSSTPNNAMASLITVTNSANYPVNTWVKITGCTTLNGLQINNEVGQVATTSGTSMAIPVPDYIPNKGTYTDSCTITPIYVALAFDAIGRNMQAITNIDFQDVNNPPTTPCTGTDMGVDIFYGSRTDSGTTFTNVDFDGACPFIGVDFAAGGIDTHIGSGSRSDGHPTLSMVYIRQNTGSEFYFENNSYSSSVVVAGAGILIDNQACSGGETRLSLQSVTFEQDTSYTPGYGSIVGLACPTDQTGPQFRINETNSGMVCGTNANGANCPQVVIAPPMDGALQFCVSDNSFLSSSTGVNATPDFVGSPSMIRTNGKGGVGVDGLYCYTPNWKGFGFGQTGSYGSFTSLAQFLTDVNINQLWQYNTPASAFLNSDTAFAALPNGTTLQKGQILAPPTYWQSSTTNKRYAIDVVQQAGTTGTPNLGLTTCTSGTPSGYYATCTGPSESITATSCSVSGATVTCTITTSAFTSAPTAGEKIIITGTAESCLNSNNSFAWTVLSGATTTSFQIYDPICTAYTNASDTGTALASSSVDLNIGQYIDFGSQTSTQITGINALNPAAIVISTAGNMGTVSTPTTLAFAPPVLGTELQLLTKASAAPTTGTWVQGDFVENSAASATGIGGWICTASGTPGTWTQLNLNNVTTGTPTLNQAACVKAVGPPVVMGYCSTVVSSSGGCTCN